MNQIFIIGIIYGLLLLIVCLRIIYETRSATKTMAYLLLALFVPVAGIIFYILFGINYWKMELYNKKSSEDDKVLQALKKEISVYKDEISAPEELSAENNRELAIML